MTTTHETLLVYDPECPLCDGYCRAARGSEALPGLRLVNAREDTPVMADIYPLLRSGRNLLLKALGRTRINNLQLPGKERF